MLPLRNILGYLIALYLIMPGEVAFAQQRIDIYALDRSKSMLTGNKFAAAREALINTIRVLPVGTHVVVIGFGTTADVVADLFIKSDDEREAIVKAIQNLKATHNYTQFDEVIKQIKLVCYEMKSRYTDGVTIGITVISDGISSPDPQTGKNPSNLEETVTRTFPQSEGYHVYIVNLAKTNAKGQEMIDLSKVNNTGVVTVTVPKDKIGEVMKQIDEHEIKRSQEEPRAISPPTTTMTPPLQQPAVDNTDNEPPATLHPSALDQTPPSTLAPTPMQSWWEEMWSFALLNYPYLILGVVLIGGVSYFIVVLYHKQRTYRQTSQRLTAALQQLPQKQNGMKRYLKMQEFLLDRDGKVKVAQPEQLFSTREHLGILSGTDLSRCTHLLRSEKAPPTLLSSRIEGNSITIRNEADRPIKMNGQLVKRHKSKTFSIDEKVSILFNDQILVTLESLLVATRRNPEDLLGKLIVTQSNETKTFDGILISQ